MLSDKLERFRKTAVQLLLPIAVAQIPELARAPAAPSESSENDESVQNPPLATSSSALRLFSDAYEKAMLDAFIRIATEPEQKGAITKGGQKIDLAERISRYSLVDNETLKRQILLNKHAVAIEPSIIQELSYLSMRIERLSDTQFSLVASPFHPQQLGAIFLLACTATSGSAGMLDGGVKRWIATSERLCLEWLQKLNAVMLEQRILPYLDDDDIEERYHRREEEINTAKELRKTLMTEITGQDMEGDAVPESKEVMLHLNKLIKTASVDDDQLAKHVIVGDPNSEVASKQDLIDAMSKISHLNLNTVERDAVTGYAQPVAHRSLAEILNSYTDIGTKALDEQLQSTIAVLSMMFDKFQAEENIADPIKALLSGMQLPMLKTALNNENFLVDSENPAQQLINEMARVGSHWSPKKTASRDPVYKKIESIVDDVQEKYQSDDGVFEDNLHDLLHFVEKEDRKSRVLHERLVEVEHAKARTEMAQRMALAAIRDRVAGQQLPLVTAHFIQDQWQQVLFFLYNKDANPESEPVKIALNTLDDLLQCVQGHFDSDIKTIVLELNRQLAETGFEKTDREDVLRNLTAELKIIRSSVARRIATARAEAAREQFQAEEKEKACALDDALDVIQTVDTVGADTSLPADNIFTSNVTSQAKTSITAELNSEVASTADQHHAAVESLPIESSPVNSTTLAEEEPAQLDMVALDLPPEAPVVAAPDPSALDKFDELAAALRANSWLKYSQNDVFVKIKLAAIIKQTGLYIFVNRDGIKVITDNRAAVAAKLRTGDLVVMEDSIFFDRALESIIHSMRR